MTVSVYILAAVFATQAPAAGNEEMAAKVKRLVRMLGDDELAEREKAERSLRELGSAALDALPTATATLSAEEKTRLERVRSALEKEAIDMTTRPTVVTLMGSFTAPEACAAIEKQTGNKIVPPPGDTQSLKLAFEKVPFWEAVDRMCDEADWVVSAMGEDGALRLVARPTEHAGRVGKAGYGGVFRFEAMRVLAIRDLRITPVRGLKVTLEIAWEPRLQPISLEQPLGAIKAVDENGDSLALEEKQNTLTLSPYGDRCSAELELPLTLPGREVHRIATLAGTLSALVPGRIETYRFEKPTEAKNEERRKGGVSVVLRELRKNQELYEAKILVRFDEAANALESHRGWIDRNEAAMVNGKGERLAPAAFETGQRKENEQAMSFLFDVAGDVKDYAFEYTTPAGLVKMPIKYELRDIALP